MPKEAPTFQPFAQNDPASRGLIARLGLFDATMIVMGGIVGSGIFITPYVVARLVHSPALILGAWIAGGVLALMGAFIYAELADRMPKVGGQYAYLREAYHPAVGFLYGWVSLLVIHAGGSAATAVTFASYFRELSHGAVSEKTVAVLVVAALAAINCIGVRAGSGVQSAFMVLRIAAIALVVGGGAWFLVHPPASLSMRMAASWHPLLDRSPGFGLLSAFGAAMVPVMFAYGGWQSSNYIAAEIRDPRKNLPRALLSGVLTVVALYVAANFIYVEVLTPANLRATQAPASAVMRLALGDRGAVLIAVAIALSTLGFLSQAMLTYPRVYFAMAQDGVMPRRFARLESRSRVPVAAILLQAAVTIAVVVLGTFEQILSYVVVMDWLFFGLTAACLFVFRARERRLAASPETPERNSASRVPGHPWTTGTFVVAAWLIVIDTIYKYPRNAGVAVCILLAGIPVYFLLRRNSKSVTGPE
ncbi:MAG: APC family permease [Candidatus Acidiferrales bacterium]